MFVRRETVNDPSVSPGCTVPVPVEIEGVVKKGAVVKKTTLTAAIAGLALLAMTQSRCGCKELHIPGHLLGERS